MRVRYQKNIIPISGDRVAVYASPRISAAFAAVTEGMTLFKGVKLAQILEAVYEQGKKDGARAAFKTVAGKISEAKNLVPHKNPGGREKKGA
jgi:hypothetical protein